jgi:hypothetical protein
MLDVFKTSRIQQRGGATRLAVAQLVFRLLCRHNQGSKPNILLYCSRRGGSTWLMNTIASHPGLRSEGRPFMTALFSRWRDEIPDLATAAESTADHFFVSMVGFHGEDEERFRRFAGTVVSGQRTIYPMLRVWEPYFHRVTDRVVYKMTTTTAMIEWFDQHFPVSTVLLLRHPVPTALSIMARDWKPQCNDFLLHRAFMHAHVGEAQRRLAERIMRSGSPLERHVLDWALKMLVPLRAIATGRHPNWTVVTYEQAVLEPDVVATHLANQLDLQDVGSMREQLRRPSRTVAMETADRVHDSAYLLSRWRKNVSEKDLESAMEILDAFELDAYHADSDLPHQRFWIAEPAHAGSTGDSGS